MQVCKILSILKLSLFVPVSKAHSNGLQRLQFKKGWHTPPHHEYHTVWTSVCPETRALPYCLVDPIDHINRSTSVLWFILHFPDTNENIGDGFLLPIQRVWESSLPSSEDTGRKVTGNTGQQIKSNSQEHSGTGKIQLIQYSGIWALFKWQNKSWLKHIK